MTREEEEKKEGWRKILVFSSSSSLSLLVCGRVDRMFNGHTCQRAQSIGLTCDKIKQKVKLKIINGKKRLKTF
jgi:hypothetical protein